MWLGLNVIEIDEIFVKVNLFLFVVMWDIMFVEDNLIVICYIIL